MCGFIGTLGIFMSDSEEESSEIEENSAESAEKNRP